MRFPSEMAIANANKTRRRMNNKSYGTKLRICGVCHIWKRDVYSSRQPNDTAVYV